MGQPCHGPCPSHFASQVSDKRRQMVCGVSEDNFGRENDSTVIGQFNNYLLGFKVSTLLRHLYFSGHLHREKDIAVASYNWLTKKKFFFCSLWPCDFVVVIKQPKPPLNIRFCTIRQPPKPTSSSDCFSPAYFDEHRQV